jgi:large subunit ribosomal protein L21e
MSRTYIRNLLARNFLHRRIGLLRRSKGFRTKTRTLISRKPRDRGKQPLGRLLIPYAPGQTVRIMINPAVQKGMPHRRYHGRVGMVAEKRGRSYVVEVAGTKTPRIIIARPEHITPVEESS